MTRAEQTHPTEKKGLAIGVDEFLEPGNPAPQTFVQIWNTAQCDQPCDEGPGGFNNILVNEIGLDCEGIFAITSQHGFGITRAEIAAIID